MFEAILMLMLLEPATPAAALAEAPLPPTLVAPVPRGHARSVTAPPPAPTRYAMPSWAAGDARWQEPDALDAEPSDTPASPRSWQWLFQHGARQRGTLAPHFVFDAHHVF